MMRVIAKGGFMVGRKTSAVRGRLRRSVKRTSPAARKKTPRESMVLAAAALLGERGLAGTSFSEVLERSGAPRGSIYHHFPEGKEGLMAEATTFVGDRVLALFRHGEGETPRAVVRRIVAAWRGVQIESGFKAGCPIAAVSSERLEHPELGVRAAAVFVAWERELEKTLLAAGMPRQKAAGAASLILAALQGALMLCRARREIVPLDAVGAALEAFVGR
jgi:TetR/AcrR family transcriptional regulator, lmrAB and yxaGH operons repressor